MAIILGTFSAIEMGITDCVAAESAIHSALLAASLGDTNYPVVSHAVVLRSSVSRLFIHVAEEIADQCDDDDKSDRRDNN